MQTGFCCEVRSVPRYEDDSLELDQEKTAGSTFTLLAWKQVPHFLYSVLRSVCFTLVLRLKLMGVILIKLYHHICTD